MSVQGNVITRALYIKLETCLPLILHTSPAGDCAVEERRRQQIKADRTPLAVLCVCVRVCIQCLLETVL